MAKFLVTLQGEHYKIKVEKKDFFFRKRSKWKNVGFYTTRFVECETANEAIEKIFEIVKTELQAIAYPTKISKLTLDRIKEDEEAYNLYAPGNGFTFYVEDKM